MREHFRVYPRRYTLVSEKIQCGAQGQDTLVDTLKRRSRTDIEKPSNSHQTMGKLAERQGFEPWVEVSPHNCLAGSCLQPLGHLSEECHLLLAIGSGKKQTTNRK